MKSKALIIGIVIVIILGALLFWYIGVRNNLVTLDETVKNSWAQVENQLKRRADLIPNLVNTVKGYASHEQEVFTRVADARSKLAGAQTLEEKVNAARSFERALGRLLMITENYPQLKANETFMRLMDELAGAENRLAVERKRFNDQVRIYNITIRRIPTNIVANIAGFKNVPYFEAEEKDKETPKVDFK